MKRRLVIAAPGAQQSFYFLLVLSRRLLNLHPRRVASPEPRDHVQLRAQRRELRAVYPLTPSQIREGIGAEAPREGREWDSLREPR